MFKWVMRAVLTSCSPATCRVVRMHLQLSMPMTLHLRATAPAATHYHGPKIH